MSLYEQVMAELSVQVVEEGEEACAHSFVIPQRYRYILPHSLREGVMLGISTVLGEYGMSARISVLCRLCERYRSVRVTNICLRCASEMVMGEVVPFEKYVPVEDYRVPYVNPLWSPIVRLYRCSACLVTLVA